ncbi:hypothetical protein WJX72_006480 [[Myrmecia] bisecta]|uniref:Uncharacterized protein n=1 Tax=[Myrmecia] bisecta TaxID=41462 RepID=A0AAW1Q422_9CHLO
MLTNKLPDVVFRQQLFPQSYFGNITIANIAKSEIPNPNPAAGPGLNKGAISGGTIGGFFFLCFCGCGIAYGGRWYMRRKAATASSPTTEAARAANAAALMASHPIDVAHDTEPTAAPTAI